MEKKAAKSKKKAVKKDLPVKTDMTFEQLLRKSIITKMPKKKVK